MKTIEDGFQMLDRFPTDIQRSCLKQILKGRRKIYYVSINGYMVAFKRNDIRDYLLEKFKEKI